MSEEGSTDQPGPGRLVVDVSWRTWLRALLVACGAWIAWRVRAVLTVALLAVLLAVSLEPLAAWAERRGLRRGITALLTGIVVLGSIAALIGSMLPTITHQAATIGASIAQVRHAAGARLPPAALDWLKQTASGGSGSRAGAAAARLAGAVATASMLGVFAFVLSLYLLVEGRRTYAWVLAFAPVRHRIRADLTAREARRLIAAYVIGNLITSAIASVFAFAVLAALGVPAALLLAVLAGLFDLVPVLGFLTFTVTAVLVAATVSAAAAATVAVAYTLYHGFENYYLVPRVYGDQLRLSNVAVLLAFALGAEIGGVVGAIVALPIAAAYPAVERLWLRNALPSDTVPTHASIQNQDSRPL